MNHDGTISPSVVCGSVMSIAVPASAPSEVNNTLGMNDPSDVQAATATGEVSAGRYRAKSALLL